ncbi:MAG: glycosyltransferase family 39 protein [Cytophagaceae bacterium]|nr:glycosyltransferase family 39 protein [Cytophagaceae bacterium]MDW8456485.1 glycosyltransferase family 39 protein [Cytophagaceae bacterium]
MTEQCARRNTIYLIAATSIVRMFLAAITGLGTGESYYFRGAQQLHLSYFDQPPLFFWVSHFTLMLFGENAFALRLPAILFFAATCWLLFLITKKFYSAHAGFYAVLLINLSAVFTISVGMWFQPDAPLMFFWMLSTYCIIKLFFPERDEFLQKSDYVYKWWVLAGLSLGFTTLSKYHVIFLVAGAFVFCLLSDVHRRWITHPGPYIALIINVILSLPIVIWNAQHNWVSFLFQGSRATGGGTFQLHIDWFLRSIAGQAAWLLPWIWLPLVWQLFVLSRSSHPKEKFLFWISVLPVVFFTVVTLWNDLQFHFHWQAPGYMMLFIPLSNSVHKFITEGNTRRKRITVYWLRTSTAFTLVTILILGTHMVTGFWTWYGPKWFVGLFGEKVDPTIDGNDYTDIRTLFEEKGWLTNDSIVAGAVRWWMVGKVDWALRGKKDVICFGENPRNHSFFIDPKKSLGKDVIVFSRNQQDLVEWNVKPYFDSVTQLPDLNIMRNGVAELTLQVYYCKNFKIPQQPADANSHLRRMVIYRQLNGMAPYGE